MQEKFVRAVEYKWVESEMFGTFSDFIVCRRLMKTEIIYDCQTSVNAEPAYDRAVQNRSFSVRQ